MSTVSVPSTLATPRRRAASPTPETEGVTGSHDCSAPSQAMHDSKATRILTFRRKWVGTVAIAETDATRAALNDQLATIGTGDEPGDADRDSLRDGRQQV